MDCPLIALRGTVLKKHDSTVSDMFYLGFRLLTSDLALHERVDVPATQTCHKDIPLDSGQQAVSRCCNHLWTTTQEGIVASWREWMPRRRLLSLGRLYAGG
eukprot:6488711-Amphidinium_carterae.2